MIIKTDYSLKKLNTFGVDSLAKKFISFGSEIEIQEYLSNQDLSKEKLLILGGGSNILFAQNFDGIIIKSEINEIKEIKRNSEHIFLDVGSGVVWDNLVKYSIDKNYGGIENLSMIPGTVGAAPIQNIGAYGVEFEEVFQSLEGIDLFTNKKLIFKKDECKFGYRDSIFKHEYKNRFIITKVVLRLDLIPRLKINYRAIQEEIKKIDDSKLNIKLVSKIVRKIRSSKLPDPEKLGNAGSFFKNPIVNRVQFELLKTEYKDLVFFEIEKNQYKIPAGWLIEKSGYKGKRFGNVGVHKYQALVLVNYGNAKSGEILALANKIKEKIKNTFNIELEYEVNIV